MKKTIKLKRDTIMINLATNKDKNGKPRRPDHYLVPKGTPVEYTTLETNEKVVHTATYVCSDGEFSATIETGSKE